jgi:CRP-like cAMP-binding protein
MEKSEILKRSELFANLLPEEIDMLSELCKWEVFEPGETVFEEGDEGDSLYIIAEGEVEVLRHSTRGDLKLLAVLKEPEFFGEMSLIDKEYRSATVKARAKTRLLMLRSENLHSFARSYPNGFTIIVINIARVLSMRLRNTNAMVAERL